MSLSLMQMHLADVTYRLIVTADADDSVSFRHLGAEMRANSSCPNEMQ
jgi:hypothetical protein